MKIKKGVPVYGYRHKSREIMFSDDEKFAVVFPVSVGNWISYHSELKEAFEIARGCNALVISKDGRIHKNPWTVVSGEGVIEK